MLILCGKMTEKSGIAITWLEPLVTSTSTVRLGLPFGNAQGLHQVTVGSHKWPCQVTRLAGQPPAKPAVTRNTVPWYAPGAATPRPREKVNPSSEPLPGTARIGAAKSIGSRKAISLSAELYGPLGDAVHAFLAADMYREREQRIGIATRLLRAHGVEGAVSADSLLSASDDFLAWVKDRYPDAKWHREWPVRARVAGTAPRLVVGEVDLYLELADGFVLLDHKTFQGGGEERDRRVLEEYAPQLRWYAHVLESALKKPLRACFIHFPIRGEIVELELGGGAL
jgi:ATP-dependent exoDNAse (exonuclease V) beta subunit